MEKSRSTTSPTMLAQSDLLLFSSELEWIVANHSMEKGTISVLI
jgi:hypothetical protein